MKKILLILILFITNIASASPISFFPKSDLGKELYEYLDMKSFRSSFGPKLDKTRTLKDFVTNDCPSAKVKYDNSSILVSCPDWHYKVEIINRQDYTEDGKEDLRIKLEDKALKASYNTVSTITVTRHKLKGAIVFAGLENEKDLAR